MSKVFPATQTLVPEPNTAGQVDIINGSLNWLDFAFAGPVVKNASTSTPPGSPGDEGYIVAATATGAWAGKEGQLAIWRNGWLFLPAQNGWTVRLLDEGYRVRFDGTSWVEDSEVGSVSVALTAATTQSQGQGVLVSVLNQVATVGTASDVVTLPGASAGQQCVIVNDGANVLQVFPASGDKVDALAVDASTTIAAGGRATFLGLSSTAWAKL